MKVDVQLQLRQLDTALTTLCAARDALKDTAGLDASWATQIAGRAPANFCCRKGCPTLKYAEALRTLEELDKMFLGLEAQKRHSLRAKLTSFQTIKCLPIGSPPLERGLGASSSGSFLRGLAAT